jgi:methylphosphotriester-DNA--protein-cysteine methyltransferase
MEERGWNSEVETDKAENGCGVYGVAIEGVFCL